MAEVIYQEGKPAERVLPSFAFLDEIVRRSGQPLQRCYQCTKCSGGCPMQFTMDLMPHQIVRYCQLGLEEALLTSRAIWVCSGCKTCQARCPNGIDIGAVNDALKIMSWKSGKIDQKQPVYLFHQAFLNSVKANGRLHELGMMLNYKVKTQTYTQDLPLGLKMFGKGTLKLLPEKINRKKEIQAIFRRAGDKS